MTITTMLLIISGALFGALLGAFIVRKSMEARMRSTTNAAQKIIDEERNHVLKILKLKAVMRL